MSATRAGAQVNAVAADGEQPAAQGSRPAADPERVGEAAAREAATAGATPEQTRDAARDAAERANPRLDDDQLDAIADRVFAKFERAGAFEPPPPPEPAATAGEATPADQPAAGDGTPPEVAAGDGPPPRKRTLAERFAGRR